MKIMKPEDIRKRMDEIYQTKTDLNNEIDEIRKKCDHSETEIKTYSWRIACYEQYHFCKFCRKPLRPEGTKPGWTIQDLVSTDFSRSPAGEPAEEL